MLEILNAFCLLMIFFKSTFMLTDVNALFDFEANPGRPVPL